LYMPIVLIIVALAVQLLQIPPEGDTFPGRVSQSMNFMSWIDLGGLMGLSQYMSVMFADSGIAYFVATQSLAGVVIIWLFVAFGMKQNTREQIIFLHGACLYLPLNLLISYSLFSIKTAALLWFVYGYLCAREAATVQGRSTDRNDLRSTSALPDGQGVYSAVRRPA
jgi:putative polymerase